ncbi:MAG: hypothetical protein ACLSE6_03540 [Alphaproteobacteria bacterium]
MMKNFILHCFASLGLLFGKQPNTGNLDKKRRQQINLFTAQQQQRHRFSSFGHYQHGLASNMEHPAVQTAKQAFLDKGYLFINFDSRHSL